MDYLRPVNGLPGYGIESCSPILSSSNWCFMYSCILAVFFPYRINVIPSTPKLPVTVFELQIAKLLIKHQTALSLQVPHKSRDTHLGRDLQKHMDVIHTVFCFQDIHVFPFAQFS
ncbi:putative transposase [Yersinia pestis Angola]|nr:putative transposase [Yersinia pestis Angola]